MNANANSERKLSEDWLGLEDAAKVLGKTPSALRGILNRGKHDFITRREPGPRKDTIWLIHASSLYTGRTRKDDYPALRDAWLDDLARGLSTGTPLRPKTIQNYTDGMNSFGIYLRGAVPEKGKHKRYIVDPPLAMADIDKDSLLQALAQVPPEQYATKEQILKTFKSFTRYLVGRGLRTEGDLDALDKITVPKNPEPRRTFVTDEQFKHLVDTNKASIRGRDAYDITLTNVLIHFYRLTGARRNELLNLAAPDVDLKKGEITFRAQYTKTKKSRTIGIRPALLKVLQDYEKKRPARYCDRFLVNHQGQPVTPRRVNRRIKWLSEITGIDITTHGFRHTLATELLSKGIPLAKAKEITGHAKLQSFEIYNRLTDKDSIDLMKKGF